jgi:hypothetical protein
MPIPGLFGGGQGRAGGKAANTYYEETSLIVWCGMRNGRRVINGSSPSRPVAL